MSDSDSPLHYDQDFDFPDVYGTTDDFAGNTLPLPVLISYDSDLDFQSESTDYEDGILDEFYDEPATSGQQKQGIAKSDKGARSATWKSSQRKQSKTQERDVPKLKLPKSNRPLLEPTVIWKSEEAHSESSSPLEDIFVNGQGKQVSLLKDWRERFGSGPSKNHNIEQCEHELNTERVDPPKISDLERGTSKCGDYNTSLPRPSLTNGHNGYSQPKDGVPEPVVHQKFTPSEHITLPSFPQKLAHKPSHRLESTKITQAATPAKISLPYELLQRNPLYTEPILPQQVRTKRQEQEPSLPPGSSIQQKHQPSQPRSNKRKASAATLDPSPAETPIPRKTRRTAMASSGR